jgi:c(7)-type cytochrome triheme protein
MKGFILAGTRVVIIVVLLVILTGLAVGQTGVKKKRALPHEYGAVIMNNYSEKAGLAPVEFDHWLHRGMFTCRLCHVDLAFGMKANSTNVRAADNKKGFYCGACHNGKMVHKEKTVFAACLPPYNPADAKRCDRCHSVGRNIAPENDFYWVTKKYPKERFGNGVDWERTEQDGYIKLVDYIEGVSIRRPAMAVQKDFTINARVAGMAGINFSHGKHTVWNGCEVCHPELFVGVKRGLTKYAMSDFYEGKFCGACHLKVAFPLLDCQRCHTKSVEPPAPVVPQIAPKGM